MVTDWKLVARPEGDNNEGLNKGGVVVTIQSGYETHEVGRVAFVRENSTNPEVSFEDQLDKVVTTAKTAIDKLKELFEGQEGLQ